MKKKKKNSNAVVCADRCLNAVRVIRSHKKKNQHLKRQFTKWIKIVPFVVNFSNEFEV